MLDENDQIMLLSEIRDLQQEHLALYRSTSERMLSLQEETAELYKQNSQKYQQVIRINRRTQVVAFVLIALVATLLLVA